MTYTKVTEVVGDWDDWWEAGKYMGEAVVMVTGIGPYEYSPMTLGDLIGPEVRRNVRGRFRITVEFTPDE